MEIEIRKPISICELETLFELRYKVYFEQQRIFPVPPLPINMLFDCNDGLPGTINLLAFEDGQPCGFVRLTQNTGLPRNRSIEAQLLQNLCGQRPVSINMCGVLQRPFQNDQRIARKLIREASKIIRGGGYSDVISLTCQRLEKLFKQSWKMQAVGTPFWNSHTGGMLSLLHIASEKMLEVLEEAGV